MIEDARSKTLFLCNSLETSKNYCEAERSWWWKQKDLLEKERGRRAKVYLCVRQCIQLSVFCGRRNHCSRPLQWASSPPSQYSMRVAARGDLLKFYFYGRRARTAASGWLVPRLQTKRLAEVKEKRAERRARAVAKVRKRRKLWIRIERVLFTPFSLSFYSPHPFNSIATPFCEHDQLSPHVLTQVTSCGRV